MYIEILLAPTLACKPTYFVGLVCLFESILPWKFSELMDPGLNIVLTIIVTVVNYIKLRPLKSKIFDAFCKDMGAELKRVNCI